MTTAGTRENLCLSVDVVEDVGVAEGVGNVDMVEPPLGCVGVGDVGVGTPSSGCAVVGDVGVVELSSRSVAVGMGAVGVDVGVGRDDHYHRTINGRPIPRQNERVGIRGGKILSQTPPRRPIGSSAELRALLGSTWRSIYSWTLSNAPIARHAFGRKSG